MIYGIGIDSADIARFEQSLEKESFQKKVYSREELAQILARAGSRRLERAAANFAAKEAFLKACGVGLGGFALAEIAALREESGKPYYLLTGKAAAFCAGVGLRAHLSLTHEKGVATAICILEITAPA